jgi:hypothetical protein
MRIRSAFVLGSLLSLMALRLAAAAESDADSRPFSVSGKCTVSKTDERWLSTALASWKSMRTELLGSQPTPETTALFFDDRCLYRADAMADDQRPLRFEASHHSGQIELPSGAPLPVGVMSFAAPRDKDSVFFVMALPSVWEAAGSRFAFDRRVFLTAVMIHEMSHVVQFRTYLQRSATVDGVELLGKRVDDDVVQQLFSSDESFAASIDEETRLLFAAALAPALTETRALAGRARALMRARGAAHYVDRLRALAQLEDLFLTLEGAGQFAALTWLTHPRGGALASDSARRAFGEDVRFWSQRQGLALYLVLDRLSHDWRATVYGDGERTVLELLDAALLNR